MAALLFKASSALNCCHKTNSCVSLARPLLPCLFYHMLSPSSPPSPNTQGPLFDVSGVMQNRLRWHMLLWWRKCLRSFDSRTNRNLLINVGFAGSGLTLPRLKLGPLCLSCSLSLSPAIALGSGIHLTLVCLAAGGLSRGACCFQTVSGVC